VSNESGAPTNRSVEGSRDTLGQSALWYTPAGDEIDSVRSYLAEIEASVRLLPELSAEADVLNVGYDPSWVKVAQ
jgi:hypothetical protein